MISYNHHITHVVGVVDTSGSIGDKERLYADELHYTYGKSYALHGVTLVVMESPLHSHHRDAP